jgi:small GTP-binding protein
MKQFEIEKYLKDNFENSYDEYISLINNSVVISILGEVSRGKSTFLNSLLFKTSILHYATGETTANIFTIEYKRGFDINSQKNIIKKINENSKKYIDSIEDFEVKLCFDNEEFKDIIFIDTPGFNTENESKMQEMINQSLAKSDMAIFILDVTKGITKEEIEQLKNLDKYGISDIMILFNKKDEVEDESFDDIDCINTIQSKLPKNIKIHNKNFYISAKQALAGFVAQDEHRIKESNLILFKNELLNYVKKIKKEKSKKLSSYNILVREHKKAKIIYEDNVNEFVTKLKKVTKQIDEINHTSNFLAISSAVKNFEFYSEYPTTFWGNFDKEKFLKALNTLENKIEPYKKVYFSILKNIEELDELFNELNNYFEDEEKTIEKLLEKKASKLSLKLFDSEDKIDSDIYKTLLEEIDYMLFRYKTNLMLKNVKLVGIYANIVSIESGISKFPISLSKFYIKEKDKDWGNCREDKALPKLEQIYNESLESLEKLNVGIDDLLEKNRELKNEI